MASIIVNGAVGYRSEDWLRDEALGRKKPRALTMPQVFKVEEAMAKDHTAEKTTGNRRVNRRVVRRKNADTNHAQAAERYGFRIAWQPADKAFVATCLEFPAVRAAEHSSDAALRAAQRQVAHAIGAAEAAGQEIPEPIATRTFSGKLQVRLGEDLHRQLAEQAADNGMSLNQLIVKKLSAG